MKIGMLEDDIAQANLVKGWLIDEGYDVVHCATGADFNVLLKQSLLDLVILDWQLPDTTGIDVLGFIRQELKSNMPVLFATQRDSENDVVTALKAGADDYLVKPLRHSELVARVAALGRRAGIDTGGEELRLGPILIDTSAQSVYVDGEAVKLTSKDYLLTCCVVRNVGKLLSREYLLKEVWGVEAPINTRTVDVHMSRIRRKLKIGPEIGYCIKTIYQHGYRLERLVTEAS